jgi:hypothetical protein
LGARLARLPLLAAGVLSLLYGAAVGLVRLGWPLPLLRPDRLEVHGPLMLCGFLGAVIGLERAVALGRKWAFAAPALAALGALALLAAPGRAAGGWLLAAASLALLAVYGALLARQASLFTATMALGAALWLGGNLLRLAGRPLFQVVWPWAGFPLLTIAGERLELTRFLKPTRSGRATLLAVLAALTCSLAAAGAGMAGATRAAGVALLALAAWLARYDAARRTVRQEGLTRFVAVCLLSGYAWLAVAGAVAALHPEDLSGPAYDAVLHALFLGFVFSMIFGHAPIIFPAVLGVPMAFRPAFYAHLLLLHASLALRLAGDLDSAWGDGGWGRARPWGGLLNAVALLLFLFSTVRSLRRGAAVMPSSLRGGGPRARPRTRRRPSPG